MAIRETGYASWGSLRPHFWIPLGFDAGEAGVFFGAATGGADAVERYAYVAEALVSGAPARAQGYFFLLSQALGDPTLDFYFSNDWSLVGIDSTLHVVSEEHREGSIGAFSLNVSTYSAPISVGTSICFAPIPTWMEAGGKASSHFSPAVGTIPAILKKGKINL